jgi:hypothetical protein
VQGATVAGEKYPWVFRFQLSISRQLFVKNVTRNGSAKKPDEFLIFMNNIRNYRSMGAVPAVGAEATLARNPKSVILVFPMISYENRSIQI